MKETFTPCRDALSGWRLDKRVSVGHIGTTLAVAVSLALYLGKVDKVTELNGQAIAYQAIRTDRLEMRTENQFREIKELLARIEQKLDRKADR